MNFKQLLSSEGDFQAHIQTGDRAETVADLSLAAVIGQIAQTEWEIGHTGLEPEAEAVAQIVVQADGPGDAGIEACLEVPVVEAEHHSEFRTCKGGDCKFLQFVFVETYPVQHDFGAQSHSVAVGDLVGSEEFHPVHGVIS